MPNVHVPAAATGLPQVIAALLPADRLAKLSHADLYHLSAALQSASDTFAYCPAKRVLEELNGALIGALGDIRQIAERRAPSNPNEAEWRGWLIAAQAAFFSRPLTDIAAAAASAAAVERSLATERH